MVRPVFGLIASSLGAGAIGVASLSFAVNYAGVLSAGGIVAVFLGNGIMVYTKLVCWPKNRD
jgi:hypothetical protein